MGGVVASVKPNQLEESFKRSIKKDSPLDVQRKIEDLQRVCYDYFMRLWPYFYRRKKEKLEVIKI